MPYRGTTDAIASSDVHAAQATYAGRPYYAALVATDATLHPPARPLRHRMAEEYAAQVEARYTTTKEKQ